MLKKIRFLMVLTVLLSLLVVTGCVGGLNILGGTSIKGQVVLNGVGTNNVTLSLWANGQLYFGDAVSSNGAFSHSNTGLDSEFCMPGKVITFYFQSTDSNAFATTSILNYVVTKGVNDLGKIEIGTKGLTLTAPTDNATISIWPATFSWNEYTGVSTTREYIMSLNEDTYFGPWTLWSSNASAATSCQLAGTEDSLDQVTTWDVNVSFQNNGLSYSCTTQEQGVTLNPPI